MIKTDRVGITVDREALFADLSIVLQPGDKVGVVGPNGSGKTTLLHVLAGVVQPTQGVVERSPNEVSALVSGHPPATDTVRTFVGRGLGEVFDLHQQLDQLTANLESACEGALQRYGEIQQRIEQLDGWSTHAMIDKALTRVGIAHINPDRQVGTLSGGELARASMARVLVAKPTSMLLDEPTNHLDATGIRWLTSFLRDTSECVVLVTYNRQLLDDVAQRIIEIDDLDGTADVYPGNYSSYLRARADKDRRRRQLVQAQEKYRKRLENDIAQARSRARALETTTRSAGIRSKAKGIARQAKARERRLHALLASSNWVSDVPLRDARSWILPTRFAEPVAVRIDDANVRAGERSLLRDATVDIRAGDHVLIQGDNGSGKTTLIKVLLGQLVPNSGTVNRSATRAAYTSQDLDLPPQVSAMEHLRREVGVYVEDAQVILSNYLFDFDTWSVPIARLSRGERRRLQLAIAFNAGAGFTVLDEPTNYLDFEGLELLEKILPFVPGTLVIVSHDVYLQRAFAANLVLEVDNGRILQRHQGGEQ